MRRFVGRRDEGAAAVDFVLVGTLLTLLFVAVVQLAVVLHVRNTLIDCASEGARYAALAGREPADGAARARLLISGALSPAYAGDVTAGYLEGGGARTVEVRVRAALPLVGLLGPARALLVSGHAADEGP